MGAPRISPGRATSTPTCACRWSVRAAAFTLEGVRANPDPAVAAGLVRELPGTVLLVLGGAGVDTIVHVPGLPLPFADSYMIHPGITTRAGQSGDFVALGLTALGLRTHHIDMIGDDHEGDLVRALHRDHGIPLTAIPQPAGIKRAVNLVGPDGRRLSLYDDTRSHESDRLPETTVRELAASSRHAHVVITYPCA